MTMPRLWLALVLLVSTAAAVPGCGGDGKLGQHLTGAAGSGAAGSQAAAGAAGNGTAGNGTAGFIGGVGGASYSGPPAGSDDGTCNGQPLSCVPGGPAEDGATWCGDAAPAPGWCREGQRGCADFRVDKGSCTCTEPGPACSGAACTPHGWVCLCGEVNPGCWFVAGAVVGTNQLICGDRDKAATCYASGAWSCDIGRVPGTMCANGPWTCSRGQPHDQGCVCSGSVPQGCAICWNSAWSCTESSVDGSADASGG
jgi:hypothetical protein